MSNVEKLTHIANQQRGYFTTRQALEAGYSKDRQYYHVSNKHWVKVDRSVYRLTGFSDTLESQFVRWSLWAIGRDHDRSIAISHQSALYYYGLQGERPFETHLTISKPVQRHTMPPECVVHLTDLTSGDYVRKAGFNITTPHRTLRDLRPDLIYKSLWLNTVGVAWGKGLIEKEVAGELLGEILYQQMLYAEQSWAKSGYAVGFASVSTGALPDIRGGGDMYGRVCMRRGECSEWRVPNRSFTLVELLVVIFIIVTLMGLLMPNLHKAIESARSTQCQSNLMQISQGLVHYGDDNNGFISSWTYAKSGISVTLGNGWVTTVPGPLIFMISGKYVSGFQSNNNLKEHPLTTCPTFWPDMPITGNFGGSPGSNAYINGGTYAFNCHLDQSLMSSYACRWKRFSTIKRPSKRFVFGEGNNEQYRVATSSMDFGGCYLWYGHNGSSNFQFADGHVESRTIDSVAIAITWPTQPFGADSVIGEPW